jgi:hypothetical protein
MDLRFLADLAAAARSVVKSPVIRKICTILIIRTRFIVEEMTGIHRARPAVKYPVMRSPLRVIPYPVPRTTPTIPLFSWHY